MTVQESEAIQLMLLQAARLLTLIPTDDMKKFVAECERSVYRAESLGPLFDPTAYMKDSASGKIEDAKHQNAIAQCLLAARIAIDKREAHRVKILPKT